MATRKQVIDKMIIAVSIANAKVDTLTLSDRDASTAYEIQGLLMAIRDGLEAIK